MINNVDRVNVVGYAYGYVLHESSLVWVYDFQVSQKKVWSKGIADEPVTIEQHPKWIIL